MTSARFAAPFAAVFAALAGAPSLAGAQPTIADISGAWTGSGTVQRDDTSKPMKVNCTMTGQQPAPDALGFAGECRAMLIMRRPIGATFLIKGDRVTGTYTGATAGIAQLDGRAVSPTEWRLEMTFPREVNGDDKAEMTIENPGDGTFRIVTTDKMLSGADVTTSDVVFRRD